MNNAERKAFYTAVHAPKEGTEAPDIRVWFQDGAWLAHSSIPLSPEQRAALDALLAQLGHAPY